MHEATIAQSILQTAAMRAAQVPGARVQQVRICVGALRNVDPDSLEFAFTALKKDVDVCREAGLEITYVPAQGKCLKSGHTYELDNEHSFRCSQCDSGVGEILSGDELYVAGCTLSVPVSGTRSSEKGERNARNN